MSEYDPFLADAPRRSTGDRDQVQALFQAAAGPYLRSPWGWFAWSVALPAAALATRPALRARGPSGVLLLWSLVILAAGLVEAIPHLRLRKQGVSSLATWALRGQANLSFVGAVLSAVLLWIGEAAFLPGLWLLLLGHSLFLLGGLVPGPLRRGGLLLQTGGLCAMWPRFDPLQVFALTAFVANVYIGWNLWRADGDAVAIRDRP